MAFRPVSWLLLASLTAVPAIMGCSFEEEHHHDSDWGRPAAYHEHDHDWDRDHDHWDHDHDRDWDRHY
jgi:hypothetical protein